MFFVLFTTVDPSKKLPTDVFVLFTTVEEAYYRCLVVFTTLDPSKKLPADVFVLFTTVEEAHYRCLCIFHNCRSQQEAHEEVSVYTGNQKCLGYFRW